MACRHHLRCLAALEMFRPAFPTCAVVALAALATATAGGARAADDFAPITPYRPSVSNPAQLPAPGQIEAEIGGLRTRASDARRTSLPFLLKLGFSPEWGLLIGGEAHVWQHDSDGSVQGAGDTTFALKHAWLVDEATAFGAELGATVPSAGHGLGSGKADYTLNTIFSRDLGPVHLDLNLNATRLGAPDAGAGRARLGASAAFSTPISAHWGATAELSGTRQGGTGDGSQLLAALTYSPTKELTLDVGVSRAWRPSPGSTGLFAGVVFPIAKLW